ncbi:MULTISPECIES: hypothetical protein [Clostridium]|uniref:hypothetical protein n=1 Tax=Clostridium TaxID=1485 RepID=UPI0025800B0B|nr:MULTISPECIES: hypothetical protein [Clostridium]MBS4842464.1 hypothetical protein [Clostridium sp.]MDU1402934.1 hypothetical protein [Clostridium sp.]MDU1603718.1 hypothetical protein [Clostridium sp.]MDU2895529.1 hypothetical protein [Clostridium sp.]MDU3007921.1 hypothetical protein [Clostridium sp.]
MKIEKKNLDEMYRAYASSSIEIDGNLNLLIASEEKGYPCYSYSGKNFNHRQTVWEDGGGCMSIIPIPNRANEFLAVRDFYLKESPSSARLVWGHLVDGEWVTETILKLPYLHRFDLWDVEGEIYFIGATIADLKDNKEDWSRPGTIYYGKLPDVLTDGIELEVLKTGLFRNHGYSSHMVDGKIHGTFGCDQGVFEVVPMKNEQWQINCILEKSVGEIAWCDIDNDGIDEMMTIEPFHGDSMKIYKLTEGKYSEIYSYPYEIDFAHTLVGTKLCGEPVFVGGVRRKEAELFMIQYIDGKCKETIIEKGVGPANIHVINLDDCDLIVSANHTDNKAAVYTVRKE